MEKSLVFHADKCHKKTNYEKAKSLSDTCFKSVACE